MEPNESCEKHPKSIVTARSREVKETCKGNTRIDFASIRPNDELGQIHSPVGRFAIENPTLRLFQGFSQFALGKTRLFSQNAEEWRQASIGGSMLGLGRHLTRLSGQ